MNSLDLTFSRVAINILFVLAIFNLVLSNPIHIMPITVSAKHPFVARDFVCELFGYHECPDGKSFISIAKFEEIAVRMEKIAAPTGAAKEIAAVLDVVKGGSFVVQIAIPPAARFVRIERYNIPR